MGKKQTTPEPEFNVVRGRFVLQTSQTTFTDEVPANIAAALPVVGVRPLGEITIRESGDLVEVAVDVELGPKLGELRPSLQMRLGQLVKERSDLAVNASELFNCSQRLATQPELQTALADLDARSDDMTLPLRQRRVLADEADQMRSHVRR